MNIAFLGVGAMASFYAQKLHPHAKVILLGRWREQIEALNKAGLKAYHLRDRPLPFPFKADVIVVLVKSYQTYDYAPFIKDLLAPWGHVVSLQNGIGHGEILAQVVGRERCLLGVTYQGARIDGLGLPQGIGEGKVILPHCRRPPICKIASLFRQADISVQMAQAHQMEGIIWSKLIVNASINPITAFFEVPNGHLVKRAILRSMMLKLGNEAFRVAQALSLSNMSFNDELELEEHLLHVAHQSADNYSSMWQDRKRGAPTEIDFINGAIVEKSKEVGHPAFLNELLFETLRWRP